MPRVAVLGAGVSGLAAALHVQDESERRGLHLETAIFDRGSRAGGCVQTIQDSGYTMELGPDSLLADKPAARDLLRRLGLESDLVAMRPEFRGSRIVHHGRLRPIPSEFRLFTPKSLPALLTSGIFSPAGIARAAFEPFIPARTSTDDESLASFVTRRFGREVLDRLAQPLIGGIYSGDPRRLSMRATLPQFLELERRYGSLVRAMKDTGAAAPPQLMSLRGGLQSLVDALAQRIGTPIRGGSELRELAHVDGAWHIAFTDGSQTQADAVILALPAYAAARALRPLDEPLAAMLERIRYNSIATVNVAYDAADLPALPQTPGFVVPFVEGRRIAAATISTQKYPDRSPQAGVLLRAFIGGALQPELVELPDTDLAQIAREEFRDLLGITAQPNFALTRRWMRMLPEYGVGHLELVRDIETHTGTHRGLALAGSAYHGVGIPDCVASGRTAAEQVLAAWEPAKSG
ncbi:MAG TPA: protoporphyrinogen oxidase [Candidatus Baltobacteraceae bacterium]|nr:protoporphyrinogen oxidase [Candidatus Baltobacteraceae bacterium]